MLSPSTRDFDSYGKLAEYRALGGVDCVGLVETNAPLVWLWEKTEGGEWRERRIEGLEATVNLRGLGVGLPMEAIYDGVVFPDAPRPVTGG